MPEPSSKTPLELLAKQTQLLEEAGNLQAISLKTLDAQITAINTQTDTFSKWLDGVLKEQRTQTEMLTKWLDAVLKEQRTQSSRLGTISTVVQLFALLTLLGIAIMVCSSLSSFGSIR